MATTDPPKEELGTYDPATSPFLSLAEEREAETKALRIELEAEIITQHEFDARILQMTAAGESTQLVDTSWLNSVVVHDHIPALDDCVIIGSTALKYWTGDPCRPNHSPQRCAL